MKLPWHEQNVRTIINLKKRYQSIAAANTSLDLQKRQITFTLQLNLRLRCQKERKLPQKQKCTRSKVLVSITNPFWTSDRRVKIETLSPLHFCTTTPPPNQRTPSQIDPAPNGNGLGHYTKSYINYMPSKLGFIMVDNKITLSATNYMQKCPRNSSEN